MPGDPLVARLRTAGCVYAEDEAALLRREAARCPPADGATSRLTALADRRVAGEPLEQVLGWAELAGVRTVLDPGVFAPRRRSELLVRAATARTAEGATVLDLCCGSGAIGAAIGAARPGATVHGADADPAAVRCARRNLDSARVYLGDLYAALPSTLRGRVDVLAVHAPYVPTAELSLLPAEARLFEPTLALDGGADGLAVQRRVVAGAPGWLAPGGHLLLETGAHLAAAGAALMAGAGLTGTTLTDDDSGAAVVIGRAAVAGPPTIGSCRDATPATSRASRCWCSSDCCSSCRCRSRC